MSVPIRHASQYEETRTRTKCFHGRKSTESLYLLGNIQKGKSQKKYWYQYIFPRSNEETQEEKTESAIRIVPDAFQLGEKKETEKQRARRYETRSKSRQRSADVYRDDPSFLPHPR